MMKKKILSAVLAVGLMVSSAVPAMASTTAASADSENIYTTTATVISAPAVSTEVGQKLKDLGLMTGYPDGTLGLEKNITRAEFATLLIRAMGYTAYNDTSSAFSDVSATHWAKGYINMAKAQGLISGYPDGTFKPEQNISLAEAQAMMIRALGYGPVVKNAAWPYGVLAKSSEIGLSKDISSNFAKFALRGEITTMLDNSLEILMMKAIGWESDGSIRYEVDKNSTFLGDKLNLMKIEGVVTAVADTTSSYDNYEFKIGDYVYSLKNHKDVNGLLGEKVVIFADKDRNVVHVEKSKNANDVLFAMIDTVSTTGSAVSIKIDGKNYTFDSDAIVYINGSTPTSLKTAIAAGQYGKFIVDGDNISFATIVSFNKSDLIAYEVDGNYIKYTDLSASTGRYVKDSYNTINYYVNGVKAEDSSVLKKGDVFSVQIIDDVLNIYVAAKVQVNGELKSVYSDKVNVGGTTYEYGDKVTYSENSNEDIDVVTSSSDLDNLLGEKVTISFGLDGKVRHIMADSDNSSKFTAIVVKKWESDKKYVKVFNTETKHLETYYYTDSTDDNASFSSLNTKADAVTGFDVVEMKVSGEKITQIDELTTTAEAALTKISDSGYIEAGSKFYVDEDTIFVKDAVDTSDMQVYSWDDIKDFDYTSGAAVVVVPGSNVYDKAKAVIITSGFEKIANDIEYAVVVDKFLNSDGKGLEISTADGVKDVTVADTIYYASTSVGSVVSFRYNVEGKITDLALKTPVAATVEKVSGGYVKFVGDSNFYRLNKDIVVYNMIGMNVSSLDREDILDSVGSISDISVGQSIKYVLDADNEIVNIFIINE